jgi:hypothetical protein
MRKVEHGQNSKIPENYGDAPTKKVLVHSEDLQLLASAQSKWNLAAKLVG